MKDEELTHYGVGHLHGGNSGRYPWGSGKYRNSDGSLNARGIKKAKKLKNQYKLLTGKKIKGKIPEPPKEINKRTVRKMSDSDISNRINRLQNEQRLLNLQSARDSGKKKFMKSLFSNVIVPGATRAGANLVEKVIFKKGSEALGLYTKDANSIMKDEINKMKTINEYKKTEDIFSKTANSYGYEYRKKGKDYFENLYK